MLVTGNLVGGIDDPFRVRYYDQAMDCGLWERLADTFPTESEMASFNSVGLKNRLCDRDAGFAACIADRPEWGSFVAWLRKNFLRVASTSLSLPSIGKSTVRFEFSSLPGQGGEVMPHPDTEKKVATAVIFFDRDWDGSWGGAFEALRHRSMPDADWTDRQCGWDEVDTVLAVNVGPNRVALMKRQHNSLHGVRPLTAPRSRRTVTVNLIGKFQ